MQSGGEWDMLWREVLIGQTTVPTDNVRVSGATSSVNGSCLSRGIGLPRILLIFDLLTAPRSQASRVEIRALPEPPVPPPPHPLPFPFRDWEITP